MRKVILILLLLILFSCKTTKSTNCDAYGKVSDVKNKSSLSK